MSGIAGIVATHKSGPIEEALLRAMNDTMLHRGPDGHGLHLEPGVGLAHRRLRHGRASRDRVVSLFSISTMVDNYRQLY
jgi:asparagine synthetase B (glutamine-hydrolysing)